MKKKSSYYFLWALSFLVSLGLLGGCVKKTDRVSNQAVKLPEEDTLKLNFIEGDVSSLDPHVLDLSARGRALGKWLFEGLTRLNLDGEYGFAGAESVEISPCKMRYLFTLRPNHYCDGTPVLAQDYERAWKEALSPSSKCEKAYLFYCIENAEKAKKGEASLEDVGVRALDEKTLLVELSHPAPYFLSLVAIPLFAPFKMNDKEVLFNGPYMLDEWKRDYFLSLKTNPFFWDKDHIGIKNIKVLSVRNSTAAFYLKEVNEIDWAGNPFSPLPPDVLARELDKGTLLEKKEIDCPFWVYLNVEVLPLSSHLIRQAFSCVLNRELIAKHVLIGESALFTFLPRSRSLCKVPLIDRDLAQGKKLFELGMQSLGLTQETFPLLTISCCSVPSHKNFAQYLKEAWEAAFGIQVRLNVQEWNTFYHDLQKGNYQVGGMFFGGDYEDGLVFLESMAHEQNFSRWKHDVYRNKVEKAKHELDEQLRVQFLIEAEEILKKEMPIIPIANASQHYTYAQGLKGVCFDNRGTPDLRWAYFEKKQSENQFPPLDQ